MLLVTSPSAYINEGGKNNTIFMAGGISNCADWQHEMGILLKGENLVLFNPRRALFDIEDTSVSKVQIEWERTQLKRAAAILFWFPWETDCPITLFELGAWAYGARKPLFVGVHPKYRRIFDVKTQLELERPEIKVVGSLMELANQVKTWAKLHL